VTDPGDDPLHGWQRRLGDMRQELRAPADAIRSHSELLLDEARDGGQDAVLADLEDMGSSARELCDLVERLLDPALARQLFEASDAAARRQLGHDLRHPLTVIKGYSDLILAEGGGGRGERFRGRLMPLMTEVGRLLAQLDAIVDFHTTATLSNQLVESFSRADDNDRESETASPGRILVVDDSAANRDLLSRRLAQQGHEVLVAENGVAALALLEREPVDLVLLDLLMPVMNGFEVLLAIKGDSRLRDVPVIIVSAVVDDDSVIRCLEAGAEDYLPKRFEPALLRARINACLRRKRRREQSEATASWSIGNDEAATPELSPTSEPSSLSVRGQALKEELEAVLLEAAVLAARNQQLTSRSAARLLARTGRYSFKVETLRKGTSKNDATDVKLGRSRGFRGSRAGLASGFSVFSGSPAGLFPSRCGLQADLSPDDHHVGAAAARRSSCTRRRML
jgi:DNA-binding response OmpR family regulator